jgi:hypothetical protein
VTKPPPPTTVRRWLHHGDVSHDIRRVDFDVATAWCGFTFVPKPFQQLTRTSRPCERCHRTRLDAGQ